MRLSLVVFRTCFGGVWLELLRWIRGIGRIIFGEANNVHAGGPSRGGMLESGNDLIDILRSERLGFSCTDGDIQSIREMVLKVVDDAKLRTEFGRNGMALAARRYSTQAACVPSVGGDLQSRARLIDSAFWVLPVRSHHPGSHYGGLLIAGDLATTNVARPQLESRVLMRRLSRQALLRDALACLAPRGYAASLLYGTAEAGAFFKNALSASLCRCLIK